MKVRHAKFTGWCYLLASITVTTVFLTAGMGILAPVLAGYLLILGITQFVAAHRYTRHWTRVREQFIQMDAEMAQLDSHHGIVGIVRSYD